MEGGQVLESDKPDLQGQAPPSAGQRLQVSNLDSPRAHFSGTQWRKWPLLGPVVLKIRWETTYVQRRVQRLAQGWHLTHVSGSPPFPGDNAEGTQTSPFSLLCSLRCAQKQCVHSEHLAEKNRQRPLGTGLCGLSRSFDLTF